jgi:putative tryptophan/tyrosine transport system substrate-binding protein
LIKGEDFRMRRRDFIAALGGAAAGWPVVARSQQQVVPVVGLLRFQPLDSMGDPISAFYRGLAESGYVEGRNVAIESRAAEGQADRLPALVADLVRHPVSVIVTSGGTAAALAAKSATATIPIVFTMGADPVSVGVVASLNRPGGNITGATFLGQELTAKRFDLLHQIVPAAKTFAYLVDPTNYQAAADTGKAQDAARGLGVRLVVLTASTASDIEVAFASLKEQRVDALVTASNALFGALGAQLAALAVHYDVPSIYHVRLTVEHGGLVSYGGSVVDMFHLAGAYAGRILKGERPADLPVQQSTRIETVLNLKTAKALGLTIPETLLATADEVIQ